MTPVEAEVVRLKRLVDQMIVQIGDLTESVEDLKVRHTALLSVVAALPSTAQVDASVVRSILGETEFDTREGKLNNAAIARAMWFAQLTTKLARDTVS